MTNEKPKVSESSNEPKAPKRKPRPERTQGFQSGYVRGQEFWKQLTVSHGREVR